jgi:hypothetical protein
MRTMAATSIPFGILATMNGTLWLANGIVRLTKPTYWAPTTLVDYTAVLLFSAAALVLGICIARLGVGGTAVAQFAAKVGAMSALATSLANLIEDGLGIQAFSYVFVLSVLVTLIALLLLGAALARTPGSRVLALPPIVTFGSVFLGPPGFFVLGSCWVAVGILGLARVRPFATLAHT